MDHPYGIHIAYALFSNPRIKIRGYNMNHPYGIKTHVHGLKSAVTRWTIPTGLKRMSTVTR